MDSTSSAGRRDVLLIGLGGAAAIVVGRAGSARGEQAASARSFTDQPEPKKAAEKPEGNGEGVAPAEDLMREHGVLNRVLLVYEECTRRLDAKQDLSPEPLADAARIVRTFIEDYHEKLEEDHLFPRYRAANKLVDLVDTLTLQHQAGRRVTERIEALATMQSLHDPGESRELATRIRQFIRMYRPHEAREDTILFPALHEIVSRNEYDALGEQFERIEHQQLGAEGFERAVERVAEIEKKLGIYDLGQFTPK
ncbi:MAG: hemerythrin domain-containing protein [Phycisphaerales bacterium]